VSNINIATLHWNQLVGMFVKLRQMTNTRQNYTRLHTSALEIQSPPAIL